jgi:catalase
MKQIIFRGKRLDNGEWVYGYYVKRPKGDHLIYWQPFDEATSNTYHVVIPETVGQFVGVHDFTNNQNIYEFDWCNAKFRTKQGIENLQGHIFFDDQEFMYCLTDFATSEIYSINRLHSFVVIGNIHDNPELLK